MNNIPAGPRLHPHLFDHPYDGDLKSISPIKLPDAYMGAVPHQTTVEKDAWFKEIAASHNAISKAIEGLFKNNKKIASLVASYSYEGIEKSFPYQVNPSSKTTNIITDGFPYIEIGQPKIVEPALKGRAVYLIMMPSVKISIGRAIKIIQSIEQESFATQEEASQRLALTLGINGAYSLESSKNEEFRKYIATFQSALTIAYPQRHLAVRVVAFFWDPWKSVKRCQSTADQCYAALKASFGFDLNSVNDALGFNQKNLPKLIPYQEIRNTILHSPSLAKTSEHFRKIYPQAIQYLHSMDSDYISLKTTAQGLYNHYDRLIKNSHSPPHAMSTGYVAPVNERMVLIKLGLELDRMVRMAVSTILPRALYMPEPNFAFLLNKTDDLRRHSWTGGSDMTTESRRLMANAVEKRLIDPKAIAWSNVGAIQTEIDEAWRTGTISKYIDKITWKQMSQKSVLQALIGLHQSYADRQILANNIYSALGKKVPKYMEDAIVPIKHLLGLFDPFAMIAAEAALAGRYTRKIFDDVILNYQDIMKQAAEFGSSPERHLVVGQHKIPGAIKGMAIIESLEAIKKTPYTDEEKRKIYEIAIDVGIAKYVFLKKYCFPESSANK